MLKLESDKLVVCGGSCSECDRRLRLYLWDAEVWGGIVALSYDNERVQGNVK